MSSPVHCCQPVVLPVLARWPLHAAYVFLFFFPTCDPPCRLSVASPPLQEEEVVAPLGHPKLQGVFQQNFLRVQPHSYLPEGREPSAFSVFAAGGFIKFPLPVLQHWSGLIDPTSAGFRVYPWLSCAPDSCRLRTSSPHVCSLTPDLQQLYTPFKIFSLVRWLTL